MVSSYKSEKLYLYLVDEATGLPVQNAKNYPILISRSSPQMRKLVPLMTVGLKCLKIVNGVASLARCLGYPVPSVMSATAEKAGESFIEGVGKESSAEGYDSLQAAVDVQFEKEAEGAEEGTLRRLRGGQFDEFKKFLEGEAGVGNYAGLKCKQGKDGAVVWTLDDSDGDEGPRKVRSAVGRPRRSFKETVYEDAKEPSTTRNSQDTKELMGQFRRWSSSRSLRRSKIMSDKKREEEEEEKRQAEATEAKRRQDEAAEAKKKEEADKLAAAKKEEEAAAKKREEEEEDELRTRRRSEQPRRARARLSRARQRASGASGAPPSGGVDWVERFDQGSSLHYYEHHTGTPIQWMFPADGIVQRWDESSQRHYYVDAAMKESSWEKPER